MASGRKSFTVGEVLGQIFADDDSTDDDLDDDFGLGGDYSWDEDDYAVELDAVFDFEELDEEQGRLCTVHNYTPIFIQAYCYVCVL